MPTDETSASNAAIIHAPLTQPPVSPENGQIDQSEACGPPKKILHHGAAIAKSFFHNHPELPFSANGIPNQPIFLKTNTRREELRLDCPRPQKLPQPFKPHVELGSATLSAPIAYQIPRTLRTGRITRPKSLSLTALPPQAHSIACGHAPRKPPLFLRFNLSTLREITLPHHDTSTPPFDTRAPALPPYHRYLDKHLHLPKTIRTELESCQEAHTHLREEYTFVQGRAHRHSAIRWTSAGISIHTRFTSVEKSWHVDATAFTLENTEAQLQLVLVAPVTNERAQGGRRIVISERKITEAFS